MCYVYVYVFENNKLSVTKFFILYFFSILICFEDKVQRQLVSLKSRLHFSFEKRLNVVLLELHVLSFTRKLFPIVFRYILYVDMIG